MTAVHAFYNLFLKMLTEGAETADAVILIRHRKSWPSPAAVAHTFREGEKKQVWINIEETREYLEFGNLVDP